MTALSMKKRYVRLVHRAYRALRHPWLRRQRWWRVVSRRLFDRHLWLLNRETVASGVAIGLFFSMMLMPFQSIPSALLAMRFRANVPLAVASVWISNPLTMPAILLGQVRLGGWLRDTLGVPMPEFLSAVHVNAPGVGPLNLASFILGMFASGVLLALCAYPLVHLVSALMPQRLSMGGRRARDQRPQRDFRAKPTTTTK